METGINKQCCLWECCTAYRCCLIGTIVTFWKVWHRWIVRKLGLSIHVVNCIWVGAHLCMHVHVCVCQVTVQSSVHRNLISCSTTALSPMLLSGSILPPYLLHGALISAINKLAHLINCCYVSSFYCIMRDYQTTWRHVPEKSSHHCGNLVSHFNVIACGQLCLIKQSCFQNVSCSVVLLPDYPSTATCSTCL